jgi:alkaline phosphatase
MHVRSRAVVAVLGVAGAFAAATVAVGASSDDEYSATLSGRIDSSKPKNVILFVGDGMGDAEVTLARYYAKGAAGRLNMDRLPFRGSQLHYVVKAGPGPNYVPNYAGDSAPTATAWSTGKRTQDNRLGQGPSTADNVPGSNAGYRTFMEIAHAAGKATGNVSTAEITDATPAGPSAHISQRACQGPVDTATTCPLETKTAGGLGSIAEQQVDQGFDVVLGGGKARYLQSLSGVGTTLPNVLSAATTAGYTQQPTDKAGLAAITSLSGGKVLGLFNNGNMTVEYKPVFARTKAFITANTPTTGQPAGSLTDINTQGGVPATGTRCDETLRSSTTSEPSLPAMTEKAIDLLDDDPDGFTLQVEGASIDKQDHAANPCGQIGETVMFDEAIGLALDYQVTHPDTLIVMTADHAHSSQIITSGAEPATGASFATLKTVDNAPIRISYGTADTGAAAANGGSQAHTGAEVPVWAAGPQAANVVGTLDETDIFSILNGKTPSKVAAPTVGPAGPAGSPGTPGAAGAAGANGTNGSDGAPGSNGSNGTNGTNGTAGPAGSNGTAGNNGVNGKDGVNGRDGANGKDGKNGKVTCKVTSTKKVACSVSYSSSRSASVARLVRAGRTVASGKLVRGKVTFTAKKKLAKGTYTLVAAGRKATLKL